MHSQNKEGIFVSACSDLRTLFSVSGHQSSNARHSTSRFKASVFAFQQHTVFLMSSMSLLMASGRPVVPLEDPYRNRRDVLGSIAIR